MTDEKDFMSCNGVVFTNDFQQFYFSYDFTPFSFFSDGYCSSPVHLTPCSRTDQSNISPQIYPEKER